MREFTAISPVTKKLHFRHPCSSNIFKFTTVQFIYKVSIWGAKKVLMKEKSA